MLHSAHCWHLGAGRASVAIAVRAGYLALPSSMRTQQVVLVVPGLLRLPSVNHAPQVTTEVAPHLARLLAAGGTPQREPDGLDAFLAPLYGVDRQTDWPLAPIRVQALGVDPGQDYWLCADPVTLIAGRDNVRLDGAVTDLTDADAAALLATLNAHFSGDGIVFVAPRPDRWFVRAANAPGLATRPLAAALGQTLRELLPAGADAGKWRRWQNEIQMLLFAHPVNAARERAGRPLVSSLWFSAGGTCPPPARPAVRTLADGGTAAVLAAFVGAPAEALPKSLDPPLAAPHDNVTLVAAYDAPPGPADAERALIAPAWQALAAGRLASVTLFTDGAGEAYGWVAHRPSSWQRMKARWRVPELASLLDTARGNAAATRS